MKNDFFHDLYITIRDVRVRDCSAMSLSHLLHGYLSVYALVRVSPVLEWEYGTLQEIHERLREIAKELSKAMKDTSIELDERIGYVADLMDAYQTYSDMDLLNEALDMAYRILTVDEKGESVIPGRTPNVCRLLCNWYYFTGEEWCWEMAEGIAGDYDNLEQKQVWQWLRTERCFKNLSEDTMFLERWNKEEKEILSNIIGSIENTGIAGRETFCFEILGMWELKGKGVEL